MISALMPLVHQGFAEDARIAMIERSHRIEGVGGMAGAGSHAGLRSVQIGVRVAHAHAHAARGGFADDFAGSRRARARWSSLLTCPARSLPELLKRLEGRRQNTRGRMNTSPHVADERPFQVNSQRPGRADVSGAIPCRSSIASASRSSAAQGLIERRRHRGRQEILRDAVRIEQLLDGRQRVRSQLPSHRGRHRRECACR